MKVYTSGDVVVNEIKVGDVHYEYDYGVEIKSTVISLPERDEDGLWTWKSKTDSGKVIDYAVNEKYAHYSPNLYTYRAYKTKVTL